MVYTLQPLVYVCTDKVPPYQNQQTDATGFPIEAQDH